MNTRLGHVLASHCQNTEKPNMGEPQDSATSCVHDQQKPLRNHKRNPEGRWDSKAVHPNLCPRGPGTKGLFLQRSLLRSPKCGRHHSAGFFGILDDGLLDTTFNYFF